MFCVRKDLIDKELERDNKRGFEFKYHKLSNKFIDWLFRHYQVNEVCENYYDSEPDFDDEELYYMYMDYCYPSDKPFSKQSHTKEELKSAYDKVIQMYKDYEPHRITFNNWQEPYFKGNWGISQHAVNDMGKRYLKMLKTFPKSIKNRLYIAKKDDLILIYFYGRDYWKLDYWFSFCRRKKKLK